MPTPLEIATEVNQRATQLNTALTMAKDNGLKVELQAQGDPTPRVRVRIYQQVGDAV
jgi:hypothetical protein